MKKNLILSDIHWFKDNERERQLPSASAGFLLLYMHCITRHAWPSTVLEERRDKTYVACPILLGARPWVNTQRRSNRHANTPVSQIRAHAAQS